MAYRYGDPYTGDTTHGIEYYVKKIVDGVYTLHGSTVASGFNSNKFSRISQEATDNARLIFDILMDIDVAEYEVSGNTSNRRVTGFEGGSFAASYYYNFGGGSTPEHDIPIDPAIDGRCQAFIDNPLDANCQAGHKQPGLYPSGGNGNYYTAVCALLGYIDAMSGFNPWYGGWKAQIRWKSATGTGTQNCTNVPPADYSNAGFTSSAIRKLPIYENGQYGQAYMDFPIIYNTATGVYPRNEVKYTQTVRQMEACYGILGLAYPSSLNGYSWNVPVNNGGSQIFTSGNVINLLEQIWYDILGLTGGSIEKSNRGKTSVRGLNTPYLIKFGQNVNQEKSPYGYFPFTAAEDSRYNYPNGKASSSGASAFETEWQYWNGVHTGRAFTRNLADPWGSGTTAANERWGVENALPPYVQPSAYEPYPWCCMVQDNDPEGGVLELIHSIQTWRESYVWTQAKITEAQTAARYWYNHFIAEHTGSGGGGSTPSGQATPAGRQRTWKWPIYS